MTCTLSFPSDCRSDVASRIALLLLTLLATHTGSAQAQTPESPASADTTQSAQTDTKVTHAAAPEDGWFDASSFLDEKYGFLPIVMPITEPAVGYGAAGGLMFLSESFGDASAGLGRHNITFVGGMGTASGSWDCLVHCWG